MEREKAERFLKACSSGTLYYVRANLNTDYVNWANNRTTRKETPLHLACKNGHENIADWPNQETNLHSFKVFKIGFERQHQFLLYQKGSRCSHIWRTRWATWQWSTYKEDVKGHSLQFDFEDLLWYQDWLWKLHRLIKCSHETWINLNQFVLFYSVWHKFHLVFGSDRLESTRSRLELRQVESTWIFGRISYISRLELSRLEANFQASNWVDSKKPSQSLANFMDISNLPR